MKKNRLLAIISALAVLAGGAGATQAQNLILNGDFTTNAASFTVWPGYTGGVNPADITDWDHFLGGGYGVNGAAVGFAGSPFGPTDAGGLTYAFMQGAGELSQNLPDTYTPGTAYQLNFEAAGRSGSPNAFF
jgi:hypothetical protein